MAKGKNNKPAEEVVEVSEQPEQPVEQKPAKKGKFSADLVAVLEAHPHINCAWVNEAGDTWHYNARPGFTAYSREEILKG